MAVHKVGAFTFVLHSHIPYVRQAGRWPHGEEWVHEAASESYLPLLVALHDLKEKGVPYQLTIGITPVLAEQLADPLVLDHLRLFMEEKRALAERDIQRFQRTGQAHLKHLAEFYRDFYTRMLEALQVRFRCDIIGAFRALQDAGYIEIATSAATHGYLPLLERDSSVYAQLKVGVDTYRRHFGRDPTAMWLPESGYRPAFRVRKGGRRYLKPGFESFLAHLGVQVFFSETHAVEGGQPVGKATGDAVGPYGAIPRRYFVPLEGYPPPTQRTTYLPYWVSGKQVAVLARNNRTGMQVWSMDWGYPGDFDYREFHKKDGRSGLQYWRVTGARMDLAQKDYYHPDWARHKVLQHAEHFAHLVEDLLADFHGKTGRYGIITAAYDTELFGHWWFEGVEWVREVLERLARTDRVDLTTATRFVREHPPEDVLALPESSWGVGGGHFTWLNGDTEWMWSPIHQAERSMEALVARYPAPTGPEQVVLQQAARELLLLESSDWPFLVTTGQAREYAEGRFTQHYERFQDLCRALEEGRGDQAEPVARELFERDKVFPDIDFRAFADREGWRP